VATSSQRPRAVRVSGALPRPCILRPGYRRETRLKHALKHALSVTHWI
jgi:hypothetical protein